MSDSGPPFGPPIPTSGDTILAAMAAVTAYAGYTTGRLDEEWFIHGPLHGGDEYELRRRGYELDDATGFIALVWDHSDAELMLEARTFFVSLRRLLGPE